MLEILVRHVEEGKDPCQGVMIVLEQEQRMRKGVSGQRVCLTDFSSVLLKVIRFRFWYL